MSISERIVGVLVVGAIVGIGYVHLAQHAARIVTAALP